MAEIEKIVVDFPTFVELMRRAGLKPEEEVLVSLRPRRIEISANPAEALWGTLKSEKSAEELRLEAYEDLGRPSPSFVDRELSEVHAVDSRVAHRPPG